MSELEYRADPRSGWHEVALDLWFPDTVVASGTAPGMNESYMLDAGFWLGSLTLGAYQLASIRVFTSEPGLDISARALKSLLLTDVKAGLGSFGRPYAELPEGAAVASYLVSAHLPELVPPHLPEADARLVRVAQAYATALVSGQRPAEAVKDALGVKISTAGYWIRRVKDLRMVRVDRGDGLADNVIVKDGEGDPHAQTES